jgi:hypothetical protein
VNVEVKTLVIDWKSLRKLARIMQRVDFSASVGGALR